MSRIVQEKFEVRAGKQPEGVEDSGWASDASARTKHGLTTRNTGSGRYQGREGYTCLPPGTNISDQEVADTRTPGEAGEMGTGSQATHDVDATSIRQGYSHKPMSPTEDMYTREHNDAFYDTVEVEGVEGFVERNNYLDRL